MCHGRDTTLIAFKSSLFELKAHKLVQDSRLEVWPDDKLALQSQSWIKLDGGTVSWPRADDRKTRHGLYLWSFVDKYSGCPKQSHL